MSEKPKEEFEDDEPDEIEEAAEDLDVDQLMRDFDTRKRRGARDERRLAIALRCVCR